MSNATITKDLELVHTGLAIEDRTRIIEILNALLADEHLLYTKTRNYHWNVRGMFFTVLHEMFEEQYEDLKEIADQIAERVRMLGGKAIGTLSEFKQQTRLSETPGEYPTAEDMVANLVNDHEALISRLRDDADACAERYNDEGTTDLLVGTMRQHEEMAWMLRAMIEKE